MRHVIETGTDGAMVCFFDPAALPDDFDQRSGDDPVSLFETLRGEGRLWFKETGGDGGYRFHFYVDEDPPERVALHAREAEEFPRFVAAGGALWACGAEYAARNPERGHAQTPPGGLRRYSHMGGRIELPAGEYAMTVRLVEWPSDTDRAIESAVRERLGPKAWRRHKRLAVAVVGLFAVLLSATVAAILLSLGRRTRTALGVGGLLGVWGGLVVGWWAWKRLAAVVSRSDAERFEQEARQEYPDFAVSLRRAA